MQETSDTGVHVEAQAKVMLSKRFLVAMLVLNAVLLTTFFLWWQSQPTGEGSGQPFIVAEGSSVRDITANAKAAKLVRSDLFLYVLLTQRYDPTKIQAGAYQFTGSESVFTVAHTLATEVTQEEQVRLTFPEGITVADMAALAEKQLPEFSADEYLTLAADSEGYVFPETYQVPISFTAADLFTLQTDTLTDYLANQADTITRQSLTQSEIITLASILEREANDPLSMRTVAGIFLNRLELGMLLQADATIEYVLDDPLNELAPGELAQNLRELDSPYNTYLYPGLPPTPIGNPGRNAIAAVLNPITSDYLFYITGNDGVFYYAETLREHNRNIATYLR